MNLGGKNFGTDLQPVEALLKSAHILAQKDLPDKSPHGASDDIPSESRSSHLCLLAAVLCLAAAQKLYQILALNIQQAPAHPHAALKCTSACNAVA